MKIISSTLKPGRKGPIVTGWIAEMVRRHGGFDIKVLDLGEVNFPMMKEPNHPKCSCR